MPEPSTRQNFYLSGHFVGGLCGGVIATLVTHPFDLIKLRLAESLVLLTLQPVHTGTTTESRPRYFGFYHGVKSVFSQTGLSGLYRVLFKELRNFPGSKIGDTHSNMHLQLVQGASANVTGAGVSWGLYFFLYTTFKFHLQEGVTSKPLHPVTHLACASIAGMLTLTVANPIWVVKTRLCLPDTAAVPVYMRYSGLFDGLRKLYHHEGARGLYRGFIPGLWGTSHGAIQFMLYEEFKKAYADYKSISIDSKLDPLMYISMAASSKLLAVCLTYPYQVVRARLQDQDQKYRGAIDILIKIIRLEGTSGFYKGVTANLLKVVPATCITFVVYENVSQLWHQQQS